MVNQAGEYHAKDYHHVVDTGEMNVLEFYMVADSFDLDAFWSMKYSTIWMCQMGMSLEYFSSFTVLSDYEKNAHFMPEHGQVEDRLVAISGLQGMKIMVCKYRVPEINGIWDRLHMTFIENKYAEDMLMCTIIRYPKINLRPNEYFRIRNEVYWNGEQDWHGRICIVDCQNMILSFIHRKKNIEGLPTSFELPVQHLLRQGGQQIHWNCICYLRDI